MCKWSTILCRCFACIGYAAVCCVLLLESVRAQSGSRSTAASNAYPSVMANQSSRTLMATPKAATANPFMPVTEQVSKKPVSLGGYCIVSLREQQSWQLGLDEHQLLFDGQLYWFASARQQAMFAAAPLRYVPALGGHCVVTFADTGERVQGEAQYGVLHDQRLFFFRGPEELQAFQAQPARYAPADLANDGRCLVSQVDAGKRLPGLPETTVIVDGQRYQFSGVHQQQKFLLDPERYGIIPQADEDESPTSIDQTVEDADNDDKTIAPKPSDDLPLVTMTNKVMGGYCPVTIREKQEWVEGKPRFHVKFDGQNYLMLSRPEQKLFDENPNIYVPAFSGYCVVTEHDEHRHVPGSIYFATLHVGQNRFYLFAGEEQKKKFDAHPERYINVDLASQGNCVVSKLDDGVTVAGLPELLEWYQGKRYYFATPEQQAKFRENKPKYVERIIKPKE